MIPSQAANRPVALPDSITPTLIERLSTRLTASNPPSSTTTSPYTGETIARLLESSAEDVAAAFARARAAQVGWAATPVRDRKAILLRFHDLLLERHEEGLDLIQAENGKTRRDAVMEVIDIANTARYYARTVERLLRPQRRRGAVPLLTHTTEHHHPKGVITVISPWNYPLALAAGDTIPALLAGNAVVQKPDTQTALTALWALDLLREAGLPEDVWQMVVGDVESVGDPLLANGDYVMFTGSTAGGRKIAGAAGQRLIGASLELGGKNPMIVLPDADLDKTVEGAVSGCFPSTGQLCVSIERMYVADEIFDRFVSKFAERTKSLRLGAAYDYSMDVGCLTTSSQLESVSAHVADAASKGAIVQAGGCARPDLGPLFYEPTILTDVTPEMKLFDQETFGPVVAVYRYTDIGEAVSRANASPYGLNASVWSRDGVRARSIATQLRVGTVNVNEAFAAAWGSVDAPMGGMGDSGLGRRHGVGGLLKYTDAQNVAHQRIRPLQPPADTSAGRWAAVFIQTLKAFRTIGVR